MNIEYQVKQQQQQRSLGNDPNGWPNDSDTIWKVMESETEAFQVGDLILNLCSRYSGYAIINLRTKTIHVGTIKDGYKIKIMQDFTVKSVLLYVDNSAMP